MSIVYISINGSYWSNTLITFLSLTYISINGSYWPNTLIIFLSLVGVIIVIVYVFIILLNSMVHLTDLDYIFVYVFWCNG